jgi:hypothetical protein
MPDRVFFTAEVVQAESIGWGCHFLNAKNRDTL